MKYGGPTRVIVSAVLLAGCSEVVVLDPDDSGSGGAAAEPRSSAAWPMVGKDPSHQGRSAVEAGPASTPREWDVALGEVMNNSPVIGETGTIYVATATTLRALSREGAEQWATPIELPDTEAPSPAIGHDGTIYTRNGAKLSAYSPDGLLVWEKDLGFLPMGSITVRADGFLQVPTGHGPLLSVSPAGLLDDATTLADEATLSTPAFDLGGRMFFSMVDVFGGVAHAEGDPSFEISTNGVYGYQAFPVASDDGTFFVAEDGALLAVSSGGAEKWRYQGASWNFGPSVGVDGTAYFAASDRIAAIAADGTTSWEYEIGVDHVTSTAIAPDGSIWAAGSKLLRLAPDGSLLDSVDFGSRVTSLLAIDADGTVVVGTEDGWLRAR